MNRGSRVPGRQRSTSLSRVKETLISDTPLTKWRDRGRPPASVENVGINDESSRDRGRYSENSYARPRARESRIEVPPSLSSFAPRRFDPREPRFLFRRAFEGAIAHRFRERSLLRVIERARTALRFAPRPSSTRSYGSLSVMRARKFSAYRSAETTPKRRGWKRN